MEDVHDDGTIHLLAGISTIGSKAATAGVSTLPSEVSSCGDSGV